MTFLPRICQCDLEQYVVRPAGGAVGAGAASPFNFTVVCLAVLHTCGSIGQRPVL